MKRGLTSLIIFLFTLLIAGCSADQGPSPSASIAFYSPPGYLDASPSKNILPFPSSTSGTPTQTKMYVSIDINGSLNVRESASSDSNVIGVLRKNDVVLILEQNVAGQWHKIQTYNGTVGYCIASYLKLTSPNAALADLTIYNGGGNYPDPPETNPSQGTSSYIKIILDSGALNVRQSPSTTSEVVGTLENGEVVKAELNAYSGWHKVYLETGAIGYIKSEFAQTVNAPESPKPSKNESTPTPSKAPSPSPSPVETPSSVPSMSPSPSPSVAMPSPSPTETDAVTATPSDTPSPSPDLSATPDLVAERLWSEY